MANYLQNCYIGEKNLFLFSLHTFPSHFSRKGTKKHVGDYVNKLLPFKMNGGSDFIVFLFK